MTTEMLHDVLFQLFSFLGGFGMFLYGMHIMAEGLQMSAGKRMKSLLAMLTSNRLMAVGLGALVTTIVQSSSATTVMIVGFVNAGLMNLIQATGVIMGANIGTTVTSWIVSSSEWAAFLKPSEIAPLAVAIGVALMLFGKNQSKKQIGEIIVGFGLLFIGLELMSAVIKPYRDSEIFKQAFILLGENPFFGVLAGFVVTAIIQSSSASVGILQTLAMNGLVPWGAAVYIILGQNIGTCVTAMLSGIGANKTAKRAAIVHLLFNLIGTIIFVVGTLIFFKWINTTLSSQIVNATDISIFHTIFNVSNTILLFPFAKLLVKAAERIVPGTDILDDSDQAITLRHLDERILETPSFAVENSIKEVVRMGRIAKDNLILATEALIEMDMQKIQKVKIIEKDVNKLEQLITGYLIKINNTHLTERQQLVVTHLFNSVNDIERIGDHATNIVELAEYNVVNELEFSEIAVKELIEMSDYTIETVEYALLARENNDQKLVSKVEDREDEIDAMEESLRESHIQRLSTYECQPQSSVVFLDVISNYERISDHALNLAYYVKDEVLL
jgi:phosphate:Na+ symporter